MADPLLWLATGVLAALLVAVAAVDARTLRIPDALTAALLAAGLGFTLALDRPLADALIGAGAGLAALWAVAEGFYRLRGYDGLGLGDAKLLGAGGAWIGWAGLPPAVLIAAMGGLALAGALALAGRRIGAMTALPFGPFLALGIGAVWAADALLGMKAGGP